MEEAMLKKIILGIVITAVLSVTAFGAVYAYQKEKARTDNTATIQKQSLSYGSGSGQYWEGCEKGDHEDCLKEEERIRNNCRYRENKNQECLENEGEEHRWQHRYEYEKELCEDEHEDCGEGNQFKNQNSTNGKRGDARCGSK
jgi:hypothetical protein